MTVNRTTLLDLPLPVTGTESGTWGDTTNNGLTQYLDIAIAGTLVLSTDADVTLTSTEGDSSATNIGATTAQYAILRWTATGSTTRNITALAQSKTYVVINATGGTQSIVLRGAGPTTGVTIISGEKALCVWNGSDFVKVSSSAAAGGSNTQVQYNSSGVLAGSSNLTFDGTSLTLGGNPTLSAGSANGVLYLNGSKVATSGSALTFDGSTFSVAGEVRANATFRSSDGTNIGIFGSNVLASGVIGVTSSNNIPLAFGVAATEQMRLTSTGLGIGTSSPAAKLNVYGNYGYFEDGTYNGYFGKGNGVVVGGGTADLGISTSTGSIVFGTGGSLTERMRLDSSGNLGIGTSSPSTRLHVVNNSANVLGLFSSSYAYGTAVKLSNSSTGGTDWTLYSFGQSNAEGAGNFGIANTAGNKFTLDSSGNLGLGVTPSAWGSGYKAFEFGNSSTQTGALFSNGINDTWFVSNAYFNGTNWIYKATGNATGVEQAAGQHRFYTAPSGTAGNAITFTQAMTLDASGRLGLGITSPSYTQQIQSTTTSSGDTPAFNLVINRQNSATEGLFLGMDGNTNAVIAANNSALRFGTVVTGAYTERARITSGGDLLVGTTSATYTNAGRGLIEVNGSSQAMVALKGGGNAKAYFYSDGSRVDIFNVANDALTFGTNNTERARITSGGDLLVGHTAVYSPVSNYKSVQINGVTGGIVDMGDGSGVYGRTSADVNGLNLEALGSRYTAFRTNGSERARIDSSGNLLVGRTSSDGYRLALSGATQKTSGVQFTYQGVQAASITVSSTSALVFGLDGSDGSTERARIDSSGNLIGAGTTSIIYWEGVYNNTTASAANMFVASNGSFARSTSSLKYKTDVQDAVHGLADVLKLRPVTYKGKSASDGDAVFGGLIAEEVHEAGLTEFVQYAEDGSPDALAYGNMVSLCIKAIQEQQALITSLTARVALLEGN